MLLKIANIYLSDSCNLFSDDYPKFSVPEIPNDSGELTLKVLDENPLTGIDLEKNLIFETDIWRLYRQGSDFIFALYFGPDKIKLNQLLKLSLDNDDASMFFLGPEQKIFHPFTQIVVQWKIIKSSAFVLHGCAFSLDGLGYIALGESTAGKSTLISTLMRSSKDVLVLNDEKNVVYQKDGEYCISPTPWRGELPYINNTCVPLDYIFYIKKSDKNEISQISVKKAFHLTMKTCFMPFWDAGMLMHTSLGLEKMLNVNRDKLYQISFNKESDVVDFIRNFRSND
jgi:hypothetical protein